MHAACELVTDHEAYCNKFQKFGNDLYDHESCLEEKRKKIRNLLVSQNCLQFSNLVIDLDYF